MTASQQVVGLKITPLNRLHRDLGARTVPFAGYEMPVQYAPGILKEHLHVRAAAGLFDVSHMGQITVQARSGNVADAAAALESVVPVDVVDLGDGRQRYALLTNDQGGIRDDLMIARLADRFFLVVNAACKDTDHAYLHAVLSDRCELEWHDDRALLGLQGPLAERVLTPFIPNVIGMRFMDVRAAQAFDAHCIVSRSGYTGEDGFELSVPAAIADSVARKLLAAANVSMIGLGARDSLRLEAGLCLYGADLDTTTTPVEAALEWSIQASRRSGGQRAGGFPGSAVILEQLKNGAGRRRVGLRPAGRAPVRHGAQLYADRQSSAPIGVVTSGGFGPSLNAPIAVGYVTASIAKGGAPVFAELRGERVLLRPTTLPFITPKYKR
jgi:aminomethyltransferase